MSLLVDQLGGLGLLDHPAVLVHSSLKGLGLTEHGGPVFSPAEVIEQLMTAAGSDTTVLFPTLTYSPDHGPTSPPHTDLRHAAALTGAIPEAGRLAAGRHRSLHPTHSVAALGGGDPGRWVAGHERTSSPCGVGSPYARLIEEGGAILLLGGGEQRLQHHPALPGGTGPGALSPAVGPLPRRGGRLRRRHRCGAQPASPVGVGPMVHPG